MSKPLIEHLVNELGWSGPPGATYRVTEAQLLEILEYGVNLGQREFVRAGVCLSCGDAVLAGEHLSPHRHAEWTASQSEVKELEREIANLKQPYRYRVIIRGSDGVAVYSDKMFKARGGYSQGRKWADRASQWGGWKGSVVECYTWSETELRWERV